MDKIIQDINYLVETLEHRQAATEQEDQAADYVLQRIKPFVDNARKITLNVVENFRLVLSAYYGEFFIISLLSFWWPLVAFIYGLCVFMAYGAEILGFTVFSRFLAFYQSSSVIGYTQGNIFGPVIVFTAYLDSDTNPMAATVKITGVRFLHRIFFLSAVVVLAACYSEYMSYRVDMSNPVAWWIRLYGIIFFGGMAFITFIIAKSILASPGANHNASGVAALLQIAERLRRRPIKASVLYFFSGAHFANMAGMRALLKEISTSKKNVYVINIEGVGAGQLCYTVAEGILQRARCSPRLVKAAESLASQYKAKSARVHHFATNAYLPLLRGINAITLLGLDEDGYPVNTGADEDLRHRVDAEAIKNAARFAESIARHTVKELENERLSQVSDIGDELSVHDVNPSNH